MKVDAIWLGGPLAEVADQVAAAERAGVDGWFVGETRHDPLQACVAAGMSSRDGIQIGTAIAVAFPRSPLHLAHAAHDLQALTGGRFVLGLGSQVKAHVERRYGATWSRPAARMRELVLAVRAVWRAWASGEPLRFEGELYRLTLMTPFFTPPPHGHPDPPVWVAAVGERMTRVAGEVADGLLCHAFTTPRYLTEVTLPRLEAGLTAGDRSRSDVEVSLPLLVVSGDDDGEVEQAAAAVRAQLAFYGSTPAYRPVLDLHGWGGLHERLHAASTRGRWQDMPDMIDDEVLETFAVVAPPDQVAARVADRYGRLVDRVSLAAGPGLEPDRWPQLVAALRTAG